METEEPWELFDLEADLQVTLSEDGKEYLRQFGLEQYDFENYQPDDDPGKYFQDVPLEQNPEALFDLLTRDSFRDSSNRKSAVTAPPRHSPKKSSARAAASKPRYDGTAREERSGGADSGAAYQNLDVDVSQERLASPKAHNKRVSFTENGGPSTRQADKENKPGDGESRSSRSVSSFFGRPKTKQNKKLENGRGHSEASTAVGRSGSVNETSFSSQSDVNGVGGRVEENGKNHKKNKKFKFPVLDLMGRTRRNLGNHKQAGKVDEGAGAATEDGADRTKRMTQGVDRLDLLQGSPELGAARDAHHMNGGEGDGGTGSCNASITDSDSDTYMSHRRAPDPEASFSRGESVRAGSPSLPEGLAPPAPSVSNTSSSQGAGHPLNIVETVTCRAPNPAADGGEKRATRGEHLPPALLAAVTGDLNLLKESIAHLSLESVSKLRDAAGNTVLHASASGGHLPCVEYICRHCPLLLTSENKAHLTPTAMAIKHGQIEVVDWLAENMNLRQELYPSHSRRRCLLHHAAKFGQDGCLRLLLSKMETAGILDDFTDQYGNTPAHIAAKYGHLLCLQTLVEFGMDVCSTNQYRHTPCYYADFNNHRPCAGYLMVVETCAMLACQHVQQARHSQWLQARNDAVSAFTTEALSLSGAIARQSSDDVDVTYRLQQTLDDSMDLVGDMASQLNYLYELTCDLQQGVTDKRHLPSPGKDDLRVSMERATELQRRLEELDQAVNHQTSRQQLVRVKDVKRRWEAVLSEAVPEVRDAEDEAKQLTRKLFSEAVQRLLVYRTNDQSSRQVSHATSPATSDMSLPTFSRAPLPTVSADQRRKDPSPPDSISLGKLSPRARVENPSIRNNPNLQGVPNGQPPRLRTREGSDARAPISTFRPSLSSFEGQQGGIQHKKPTSHCNMALETELHEAIGSPTRSSKNGSSNEVNMNSSHDQQVKNNVVESFLRSRTFYTQDPKPPKANTPRSSTNGLFYSGQTPQVSQMQTPDSLGLQMSAFSAFNRVPNRPLLDSKQSTSFEDSVAPKELSQTGPKVSLPSTFVLAGIKKGNSHGRAELYEKDREHTMGSSNIDAYDGKPPSSRTKQEPPVQRVPEPVQNLKSPTKSTNPQSLVSKLVSKIEKQDTTDHDNKKQLSSVQASCDSEGSEESISEPTIPPPPQPPATAVKPALRQLSANPRHLLPTSSSRDQSVTSSTDSATTGDDDDDEELLSEGDLGAELSADDLMLGPHTFLDDEVDEEDLEQYADHMFTPEELLALAPGGRLPLSMQFETSLSTIEEVSVVSESTRGDDNTDAEAHGEVGNSDSDDTVTQPSDHEENDEMTISKLEQKQKLSSSSPVVPTTTHAEGERPWYETSDDDDSSPGSRRQLQIQERPEHFTLF